MMSGRIFLSGLGVALLAASQVNAASLQALQGAWAMQGMDCNATFKKSGGTTSFRDRGAMLTNGIIITGNKIITPDANCTAQKIQQLKDRTTVRMSCADAVLADTITASFRQTGKDTLQKFDPDFPDTAYTYTKCHF